MPNSVTASPVAANTTFPLFRAAFLSVLLGQAVQEAHWVVHQLETQALRLQAGFLVCQANEHEAGGRAVARYASRPASPGVALRRTLFSRLLLAFLGGGLRPSKIALSRLALPLGNGGDDCCSRADWI